MSICGHNLQVAVQVKEQGHAYKSKGRSRVLHSDMPVVAALSMCNRYRKSVKLA